jgi:SRSO17 transposase
VVDESGFTQQGDPSAGVAGPPKGRLGQEDHGQIGVFRVGVTPGGVAWLGPHLDWPQTWCANRPAGVERREKVHLPETVVFSTQPPSARGLIRPTAALGVVPWKGITADAEEGSNGGFLDAVERLEWRRSCPLGGARCGPP